MKRALVFANGEMNHLEAVKSLLQPGDLLIAADNGLRHVLALGLIPAALVGDLDSTSPGDVSEMKAAGVTVKQYPVDKDETDLELALTYAVNAGSKSIRIVGALGGRLDQTLANLYLLDLPALRELDVRLDDGREEVFLIRQRAEIHGKVGDVVSLLPIDEAVSGIRTEGLHYPLNGETLYRERTRGISNRLDQADALVCLGKGMLICIHTRNL